MLAWLLSVGGRWSEQDAASPFSFAVNRVLGYASPLALGIPGGSLWSHCGVDREFWSYAKREWPSCGGAWPHCLSPSGCFRSGFSLIGHCGSDLMTAQLAEVMTNSVSANNRASARRNGQAPGRTAFRGLGCRQGTRASAVSGSGSEAVAAGDGDPSHCGRLLVGGVWRSRPEVRDGHAATPGTDSPGL